MNNMQYGKIVRELRSMSNPKNVEGMQRFGIRGGEMLGISVYEIRRMAKNIGKNHELAQKLWDSKIHEARMLACFVDDPKQVTEEQMDRWTGDFESWDICDQCCSNLFDKTPFAEKKIFEYSKRSEEFVKRTGFVLIATRSVHDKKAKDSEFEKYLPIIKREATDERNFVRKAVNWSLRQIGKRNLTLNRKAIKIGEEIQKMDSKTAKWIANDVLKELKSDAVQKRLKKK